MLKTKIVKYLLFFLILIIFFISGCVEGNPELTCSEQGGDLCDLRAERCGSGNNFPILLSSNNSNNNFCCQQTCSPFASGNSNNGCSAQGGFLNCDVDYDGTGSINFECLEEGSLLASSDNSIDAICCSVSCGEDDTQEIEYVIGDGICEDGFRGDNKPWDTGVDKGERFSRNGSLMSSPDCRRCVTNQVCQNGQNNTFDLGEDLLDCLDCKRVQVPNTTSTQCNNNGIKEGSEQCDGSDFGSYSGSCSNYNPQYTSGDLSCNNCVIDTVNCVSPTDNICLVGDIRWRSSNRQVVNGNVEISEGSSIYPSLDRLNDDPDCRNVKVNFSIFEESLENVDALVALTNVGLGNTVLEKNTWSRGWQVLEEGTYVFEAVVFAPTGITISTESNLISEPLQVTFGEEENGEEVRGEGIASCEGPLQVDVTGDCEFITQSGQGQGAGVSANCPTGMFAVGLITDVGDSGIITPGDIELRCCRVDVAC